MVKRLLIYICLLSSLLCAFRVQTLPYVMLDTVPPGEAMPIDGSWRINEGLIRIERGRMYFQNTVSGIAVAGMVTVKDIRQIEPGRYFMNGARLWNGRMLYIPGELRIISANNLELRVYANPKFGLNVPYVEQYELETLDNENWFLSQLAEAMKPGPKHGEAPVALPEPPDHIDRVAVLDLESRGLSADEILTISDNLRTSLIESRYFKVISRTDMNRILEEQKFQRSNLVNETQYIAQMGKILAVPKIVVGSVGRVGRTYSIVLRLVDVETSTIECSVAEDVKGEVDELLSVVRNLGRKLALKQYETHQRN